MSIETRPFGRTGHQSTVTLFGAAALAKVTQADADRALEVLLEYGVNHIDTAPSYGDAELRIGPWMRQHRDKFFLATKVHQRTYWEAVRQIEDSLRRLETDTIDLLQLHNLGHPDEWDLCMGPDGALKAAIKAKEQGRVRHIGVTGHGVYIAAMHLRSLRAFDFDSILLPYNFIMYKNERYMQDFDAVMKVCRERNVAVQTIKSIMRGPWGSKKRTHSVWYEPLTDQADIDRAVHWVMGLPDVFLNTCGDLRLLPKVLDAASRFQTRPSEDEMEDMLKSVNMTQLFN